METNRIEYKVELNKGLEKEVVAFLNNREGGTIYIGIDKNGLTKGVRDLDGDMLKIKDRLKNNILPSIMGLFEVIAEKKDDLDIIKVFVAHGLERPYYIKKEGMSPTGCYLRVGTAAEPMPIAMIESMFARRVRNSIRNITSDRQDLSFEQFKIYYNEKGLKLGNNFARNLELLTNDGVFNFIGYLMSDDNGTSIKVAKYRGVDRIELIENEEFGYVSLIKSTKMVIDKMELENRTFTQITTKDRNSRRLWNMLAVKEAVINAIVHNDFTNQIPPKFEIFSDRLEITSAGRLPDDLTQEDFFNGVSAPRNKEIMRIFKDIELVEHLGSGIPRILESYSKDCFTFMDNFIRITIPNSEGAFVNKTSGVKGGVKGGVISGVISNQIDLTDRQKEILEIIEQDPEISYENLSDKVNIATSAIQRHIRKLKEKGYLKRVGKTRGYWKVNVKNNQRNKKS